MQSSRVTHLLSFLNGSPLTFGGTAKHLSFKVILGWALTYLPSFILKYTAVPVPGKVAWPSLSYRPTHPALSSFASLSSLSAKGLHSIRKPYAPGDAHFWQSPKPGITHLSAPPLPSAGGKVAQRGGLVCGDFPITDLHAPGNRAPMASRSH